MSSPLVTTDRSFSLIILIVTLISNKIKSVIFAAQTLFVTEVTGGRTDHVLVHDLHQKVTYYNSELLPPKSN